MGQPPGPPFRPDQKVKLDKTEAQRGGLFLDHGFLDVPGGGHLYPGTGQLSGEGKSHEWALEIKRRLVESFAEVESPLIRKVRE